ncbi:MAG TPA: hypothetical protein GX747_03305 [Tenericutes bacterium]|nr:hypothetical protein [Mycoplasmatota bacterium]
MLEREYYEYFNEYKERQEVLIEYIKSQKNVYLTTPLKCMLYKNDIYSIRILNNIKNYMIRNNDFNRNSYLTNNDDSYTQMYKYEIALNEYITGYFIKKINSIINSGKYDNKEKDLIKLKYNLSYINMGIENIYFETKFNEFEPQLLNISIIENSNVVDNYTKFSTLKRICMEYVISIMNIDMKELKKDNNNFLILTNFLDSIIKVMDQLIPIEKDKIIEFVKSFYKDKLSEENVFIYLMIMEMFDSKVNNSGENKKSL